MNEYETVIITRTDMREERLAEILEKICNYIACKGKIIDETSMGVKNFAYKVKGHREGYYYYINFKASYKVRRGLKRLYKKTHEILKFIIVKKSN